MARARGYCPIKFASHNAVWIGSYSTIATIDTREIVCGCVCNIFFCKTLSLCVCILLFDLLSSSFFLLLYLCTLHLHMWVFSCSLSLFFVGSLVWANYFRHSIFVFTSSYVKWILALHTWAVLQINQNSTEQRQLNVDAYERIRKQTRITSLTLHRLKT